MGSGLAVLWPSQLIRDSISGTTIQLWWRETSGGRLGPPPVKWEWCVPTSMPVHGSSGCRVILRELRLLIVLVQRFQESHKRCTVSW